MIAEFAIDTVVLIGVCFCLEVGARNQFHPGDQAIGICEHEMTLWIVGGAAPVHATDVAREYDTALQTGWSKNSFRARCIDLLLAPLDIFGGFSPHISGCNFFWHQGNSGKRLSWRTLLAGDVCLRHRSLLDGKQRSARQPIKNEHVAHFCVDHHGGSAVLPSEECGLRGYVVIP